MTPDEVAAIDTPTLVAVGTTDEVAGPADKLAALMPHAKVLDIPGRDHMRAVGDRVYKNGVLQFLSERAHETIMTKHVTPEHDDLHRREMATHSSVMCSATAVLPSSCCMAADKRGMHGVQRPRNCAAAAGPLMRSISAVMATRAWVA